MVIYATFNNVSVKYRSNYWTEKYHNMFITKINFILDDING
jgi:hypothetical protein